MVVSRYVEIAQGCVLVCARAAITQCYRQDGEIYILITLKAGSLRDSGMARVGFFGGLFPWLSDGCLSAVFSCGLSSVHMCIPNVSVYPNFLFVWR